MTLENQRELPAVFWAAYDAIADFSEDEMIRFGNGIARSHRHMKEGATYEMPDQSFGWVLNIKRLKMIRNYVKQIGVVREHVLGFFGENVRGAICLNIEEPESNVQAEPIEEETQVKKASSW